MIGKVFFFFFVSERDFSSAHSCADPQDFPKCEQPGSAICGSVENENL